MSPDVIELLKKAGFEGHFSIDSVRLWLKEEYSVVIECSLVWNEGLSKEQIFEESLKVVCGDIIDGRVWRVNRLEKKEIDASI